MSVIPSALYAQVNWRFTGIAAPTGAEVTCGIDISANGQTTSALAGTMRSLWVTHVLPRQSSSITLAEVLVKVGPNDTGPSAIATSGATGGAVAGTEVPNSSVLVTKNTAFGGRRGRGRMFIPGAPESTFNSSGDQSGASVTLWQANMSAFYSALVANDSPPVLLPSAPPIVGDPLDVLAFVVESRAATQRRRLRR